MRYKLSELPTSQADISRNRQIKKANIQLTIDINKTNSTPKVLACRNVHRYVGCVDGILYYFVLTIIQYSTQKGP